MESTRRCPFCAEEIRIEAIKCKHCGERLDGAAPVTGGVRSTPAAGGGATLGSGTLSTGTVVGAGRYELVRPLGAGGMGEVYEAEHTYTGQKVALKAVWPNLMAEENARARFLQEGRTLAKLKHPAIVGLHDFFEEGGRFFLAMEFIDGKSLESEIRSMRRGGSHYSVLEVAKVLRGVCEALAHAHAQTPPVIHRDIKPSNVMLASDGRVVLMDFGIAKAVGGEKLTRTQGVVGTYEYMSPEQVTGAAVTATSDVYSVGILAYEMLARSAGRRKRGRQTWLGRA